MHSQIIAALAIVGAQPALATVDFHIGNMVWGGFGTGARQHDVMLIGGKDSHACDELGEKLLQNSDNGKGEGNFNCEGCSADAIKDWDITKTEVNAKHIDVDTKFVTIKEGSDGWLVEDGESGEKLGDCTPIDGNEQSCTDGLDNYNVFRFMRCEGINIDK